MKKIVAKDNIELSRSHQAKSSVRIWITVKSINFNSSQRPLSIIFVWENSHRWKEKCNFQMLAYKDRD